MRQHSRDGNQGGPDGGKKREILKKRRTTRIEITRWTARRIIKEPIGRNRAAQLRITRIRDG
jgi:hypothetical protein